MDAPTCSGGATTRMNVPESPELLSRILNQPFENCEQLNTTEECAS
jgi:hypothetical protein